MTPAPKMTMLLLLLIPEILHQFIHSSSHKFTGFFCQAAVRFKGAFSAKGPKGNGINSVKTCWSNATRRKLLNLPWNGSAMMQQRPYKPKIGFKQQALCGRDGKGIDFHSVFLDRVGGMILFHGSFKIETFPIPIFACNVFLLFSNSAQMITPEALQKLPSTSFKSHRSCPTKHNFAQSSSVKRKARTAAWSVTTQKPWWSHYINTGWLGSTWIGQSIEIRFAAGFAYTVYNQNQI